MSAIRLYALLLVMLSAAVGLCHEGDDHSHPMPFSEAATYKPSPIPDRIILTWDGDPTTTQAVTWRTDAETKVAIAEFAEAGDGPDFIESSKEVRAETKRLEADLCLANYHTARFVDLKPKTKYAYRVGDGVNWSEWSHFTTASSEAEPFTFVYFGDAQNSVKSMWSRVVREAFRDAPKAAFMLHAGDLINRANRDAEWGEWFYAGGFINRSIPSIATPGNHEYAKIEDAQGNTVRRELSRNWRPTFAFPPNGPSSLEETVYFVDYQAVRIISLNSNEMIEQQTSWLRNVLEENPQRWTIVTFHHPMYSSKAGRDNPELREAWQPLFDEFKVDLVLQGHDHTYARSKQMAYGEQTQNVPTGVAARDANAGTVYVVSVSGPKMYELGRRPFMRRAAENTQLYQVIHVDGDSLRFEARTAIGRLYDAFTLHKREGQVNELIEQVPETPERRHHQQEAVATSSHRASDGVALAQPTARLTNPLAQDQDDLCIWRDEKVPSRRTIITSDKSADRLFVYDLDAKLLQSVEVPKPGNIDIRSGFRLGDELVDLVVVNQREDGFRLCVFRFDAESRRLVRLDQGDIHTGPNYGGCLYHSPKTDQFYFVTTSEDGEAEQYELKDDGQGHVIGTKVRSWPIGKCEGAVADDSSGHLYIAEEEKGIWRFPAEPLEATHGELIVEVGRNDIHGDLEGIAIAASKDGDKYLVFSDQGASTFHVLPLDGSATTHRFAIEGATETDGVDVLLTPLGKQYPNGIFSCHTDGSPCSVLLTPIERVLAALGVD